MCEYARTNMPCAPASVALARGWVTDELSRMYENPATAADDAALVVSELVTNCVRAEAHEFEISVEGHRRRVTLAMTDDAPGMPVRRTPRSSDTNGRGLNIVEAVSKNWGVEQSVRAKTVWAELAVADNARPLFGCHV